MQLSLLSPEQLADLDLPDEALAALAAHEEWEYTPDVSGGSEHADWCDDCDSWHKTWSVFGLRLDADGTLWTTQYTVDTDGDWDLADETLYASDDAGFLADAEAAEVSWQVYAAFVVRTGEDPLNNYWVASRSPRATRWRVTFAEEGGTVVVREVRRGARAYALDTLPAEVRTYLCLESGATVVGIDSLDVLRAQAAEVRWLRGRNDVAEIRVQVLPVSRPATIRAAKRAAARRALAK